MKETRLIMGMPVTLDIPRASAGDLERIFAYFHDVDERFSTYKPQSEISQMNSGALPEEAVSAPMQEILALAEETRRATDGYFDIRTPRGDRDPSGIVKGWAIRGACELANELGYTDYWIDAGGDVQTAGRDENGVPWSIGIRNPFNEREVIKVLYPRGRGVATSGTYIRGNHIYDPHAGASAPSPFVSLTVVGPNIYEADRFATAAFAMGERGIYFLEQLPGFEGYAVDKSGMATFTSGFSAYTDL